MNWSTINWPAVVSALLGFLAVLAAVLAFLGENFYLLGEAVVLGLVSIAASMLSLRER